MGYFQSIMFYMEPEGMNSGAGTWSDGLTQGFAPLDQAIMQRKAATAKDM